MRPRGTLKPVKKALDIEASNSTRKHWIGWRWLEATIRIWGRERLSKVMAKGPRQSPGEFQGQTLGVEGGQTKGRTWDALELSVHCSAKAGQLRPSAVSWINQP